MNYRLALVTGATSGIGEALCHLLARQGIGLILVGRSKGDLARVKRAIKQDIPIVSFAFDLTNRQNRQDLVRQIHHLYPDLVINCAGIGLYGQALTYETARQLEVMEVNGMAVLEITLESARMMVSKGIKGAIVNISSAACFQTFPDFAVYAASKSFVKHFSESFDEEMKPYGIRVLTVCPGVVATHFQERAGGHAGKESQTPLMMTPQYVSEEIWRQIQEGRSVKIVDWRYRLLTLLSKFLPKKWLVKYLRASIRRRLKNPTCDP